MGSIFHSLARRATITPGSVSWDEVHAAIAKEAARQGEWAGLPRPVEGTRMVIHPSYKFAERFSQTFCPPPQKRECSNTDVDETIQHRNSWHSYRDGKELTIWRDARGFYYTHGVRQNHANMILSTLGAARAWDFAAEQRALATLKRHVTEWAYQAYFMTGTFLETSPRSHLTYIFRRLRPTIVLTSTPDYSGRRRGDGVRILTTLCAHAIGYYDGSWAGALVPTDDVIAHLLLMRSDEYEYWKQANQHPASAPEAGI